MFGVGLREVSCNYTAGNDAFSDRYRICLFVSMYSVRKCNYVGR